MVLHTTLPRCRWLVLVNFKWRRAPESAEMYRPEHAFGKYGRGSMGPRSGERGNVAAVVRLRHEDNELQWGRAPESAEIQNRDVIDGRGFLASMGPRS